MGFVVWARAMCRYTWNSRGFILWKCCTISCRLGSFFLNFLCEARLTLYMYGAAIYYVTKLLFTFEKHQFRREKPAAGWQFHCDVILGDIAILKLGVQFEFS